MTKSIKDIYIKNANKWIALDTSTEKLLAVGGTITEVNEKLSKDKHKDKVEVFYVNLAAS